MVFAVVAENSTREPHRLVASSIGLAIPADRSTYGYLSDHHSFGQTDHIAGDYAEELAAEMLATTLNVEFDPDKSWTKRKKSTGCQTRSCGPQISPNPRSAITTTVDYRVAAAILIFE